MRVVALVGWMAARSVRGFLRLSVSGGTTSTRGIRRRHDRVVGATVGSSPETANKQKPQNKQRYDHARIEKKWQERWDVEKTFRAERRVGKEKKYVLDMFPYPSGSGLHVGHPAGYTASDVMARYWRMRGYDVLHPMGWDAFGLPAEQHAINTGTHPEVTTKENVATFKRQLKELGFSYDWDRELSTTDSNYVRWTQWIFLQLFQLGLAEQKDVLVNWCPELGTVLANEEIVDGLSERGGHPVVRQPLRQWVLKITHYADQLLEGLEGLNWPQGTIQSQKEWIGRSRGAEIAFDLVAAGDDENGSESTSVVGSVEVFTTRPDTLFGVTYLVLAPEHELVSKITSDAQKDAVAGYLKAAAKKSDLERTADAVKTGVFSGGYARHPLTQELVPVWIADYVLAGYGSGAVMAVPAHDARDHAFAVAYDLPIKQVIFADDDSDELPLTEKGTVKKSDPRIDGSSSVEAEAKILEWLRDEDKGSPKVNYKLRDWVFSRQRYWGEPIPIYFPVLDKNSNQPLPSTEVMDESKVTIDYSTPIPETNLPLILPELEDFSPGDDPRGCLARAKDWRFFTKDGVWYARETNTMPQWAGSCWYYLRFADPSNPDALISSKADADWLPVDLYVGGAEHAVLHLLYARFWHKVLQELKVTHAPEPFSKLVHQGMILGADGEKMSKSRGNVVNPDDVVKAAGADALRLYEMFMGPLDAVKPWQTEQVAGVVRFRDKCYSLVAGSSKPSKNFPLTPETDALMHKTMKKVSLDIEAMSFNTAISAMMIFANHLSSLSSGEIPAQAAENLAKMLAPFAPHVAEEMWAVLGHDTSIALENWVTFDESKCVEVSVTLPIQVNGKVRAKLDVQPDLDRSQVLELALPAVDKFTNGATSPDAFKKVIYVPNKILNLVL